MIKEIRIQNRFDPSLSLNLDAALSRYELLPNEILKLLEGDEQRAIPLIAKNERLISHLQDIVKSLSSSHSLLLRDSRRMDVIPDESVQLVITSPPYWNLKKYIGSEGQLGDIDDYDCFLDELDKTWMHALRILVPGGRLIIVVGDVCVSRKQAGRHIVYPLHASIQEHCRSIGFDNLAPIIWHKISNAKFEASGNGSSFLGKPYEPGGIIKNDIEYILMQRKPGGYRKPRMISRALSIISDFDHKKWYQQIWDIKGSSTRNHPAPFPVELAERLIRMFSFVGDIVVDPFSGSGTTNLAAAKWARNSIGFEIEELYHIMSLRRLSNSLIQQMPLLNNEAYYANT